MRNGLVLQADGRAGAQAVGQAASGSGRQAGGLCGVLRARRGGDRESHQVLPRPHHCWCAPCTYTFTGLSNKAFEVVVFNVWVW